MISCNFNKYRGSPLYHEWHKAFQSKLLKFKNTLSEIKKNLIKKIKRYLNYWTYFTLLLLLPCLFYSYFHVYTIKRKEKGLFSLNCSKYTNQLYLKQHHHKGNFILSKPYNRDDIFNKVYIWKKKLYNRLTKTINIRNSIVQINLGMVMILAKIRENIFVHLKVIVEYIN